MTARASQGIVVGVRVRIPPEGGEDRKRAGHSSIPVLMRERERGESGERDAGAGTLDGDAEGA